MKKTMALMALVSLFMGTQIALAESRIICKNDRVLNNGSLQYAGSQEAIKKLNTYLEQVGNHVSQVSAPTVFLDGEGYTACVTITQ